jgi:hypothetical protein
MACTPTVTFMSLKEILSNGQGRGEFDIVFRVSTDCPTMGGTAQPSKGSFTCNIHVQSGGNAGPKALNAGWQIAPTLAQYVEIHIPYHGQPGDDLRFESITNVACACGF